MRTRRDLNQFKDQRQASIGEWVAKLLVEVVSDSSGGSIDDSH